MMKMELIVVVSLLATMTAFLSCLSDEIVIVQGQAVQQLRSLGSLVILVILIVMMK